MVQNRTGWILGLALLCADGTENTINLREPLLLVCQTGRGNAYFPGCWGIKEAEDYVLYTMGGL